MVLAVLSLFIPPVFRVALRQLIAIEGWRHGVQVHIERVQGSLYEPVVLIRSQWTLRSRAGCLTYLEVNRAEAEFAWRELLPGHSRRWFRRLSLDGVRATVQLPPVSAVGSPLRPGDAEKPAWYPAPTRIDAENTDLLVQSANDFLHLQESRLLISEEQPGFIEIGRLEVRQPFLKRTFRKVHGTTALQDGRVEIAELQLDPAVQVQNFSADVREIARGRLDMDAQISAFGGRILAQAQTIPHERGSELEASGKFDEIGIAPLASFLGLSDAAGGQLKVGQFTFRGSPRDLLRSSFTVRLEATDFQWETRQWDSLTLGATLMDRRVQIPELELRQGHNRLSLNGDLGLPNGARPWWQTDFNLRVAARFENLTELSALVLPDFRYAAGQMSVTGSVQSKDQLYDGQLIVTGTNLAWRSAPIQELSAAILLSGKELQVANASLRNKDDSLTAQGAFNLDEPHLYHGELRASVEDLAPYAAILQKPLVPDSLAGGATLHWTGEGTAAGPSGHFFARLRHLRPLSPAPSRLHPVDAELEGSYDPANLHFSRLNIADESCALTAEADIGAHAVRLSSLRLLHGNDVWLEGDAVLPLGLRSAWPDGQPPKFTEDGPVNLHLKAAGLQLATAARLTGWNWPIAGTVTGEITSEGKPGGLKGGGQIALTDLRLPFEGDAVPTLFSGNLTLDGQTLSTTDLQVKKGAGHLPVQAQLDLGSLRDPTIHGTLGGPGSEITLPFFRGVPWTVVNAEGAGVPGLLKVQLAPATLSFAGPLSCATLSGSLEIAGWELGGLPEISPLWKNAALPELPSLLAFPSLLSGWKIKAELGVAPPHVDASPGAPAMLGPTGPWVYPQLTVAGTGAAPVLSGTVQFGRLPALAGALPVTLTEGSITFRDNAPRDPTLDLHFTGQIESLPFNAWVVGPLSQHVGFFDSETARAQALSAPFTKALREVFPPWATFPGETPPPPPVKAP